jgi:hypothetical protein
MLIAMSVLLLFLALLAIPINLVYQVSWREQLHIKVQLGWLFGLVSFQLPSSQAKKSPAGTEKQVKRTQRKNVKTGGKSNPLAALRLRSFRQRVIKFVRDLWLAIHKRDVYVRIRLGLADPADTGRLWSVVGPVSALLANNQAVQLDIQPEFTDTILELDSGGNIRLVPLQILALLLGLCLSPPFWQGMRQMRKAG